jgi:hypothetical protein
MRQARTSAYVILPSSATSSTGLQMTAALVWSELENQAEPGKLLTQQT